MKVFVFIFFILCLDFSIIDSVNLNCQFGTAWWHVLGEVDYCEAEKQGDIITDRSKRHVNTIDGSAIANQSVKLVYIHTSNCFYFPFGLEKRFPNLEGITIYKSKLKEIRREDLKNYKNLRRLDLDDNEIKYLEPNLFEFVPKLEGIWLNDNQIAHIDPNVFNNFVDKLSYLGLSGNICEFENAYKNTSKANEIIEKVQSGSCNDESKLPTTTTTTTTPDPTSTTPPAVTSAEFDALTKLIQNLQVSLMQEVKTLRSEVNGKLATLNDKFETLNDKFEASEAKLEASLKSQVQILSEQNSETKSEILEIKSQNLEIKAGLSNITAQFEKRIKFMEKTLGVDLEHHNQP